MRFVGAAADPATRTFDVELEIPNPDGRLRDGVTAEFTVFAKKREAYLIPRSALTLDDKGAIGVRIVNENSEVEFAPVRLLGEDSNGVWTDGISKGQRLITRGQDFVKTGQRVNVVDPAELSAGAIP